MKMVDEFKKFIAKGNVMDLAVGMIIGSAFTAIVTSLVNDVIMPILSLITGKVDFNNLFVALNGESYATLEAAKEAGAACIAYGSFINAIINFLLVALVIFFIVKALNKFKKKQEEAPKPAPEPSAEEKLLTEIRDLLKNQEK